MDARPIFVKSIYFLSLLFLAFLSCTQHTSLLVLLALVLLLILTLPLELVDGVLGTIRDQIAAVVDTGPLGLSVVDVEDSSGVEHVAA